jgi:hypothetical protein
MKIHQTSSKLLAILGLLASTAVIAAPAGVGGAVGGAVGGIAGGAAGGAGGGHGAGGAFGGNAGGHGNAGIGVGRGSANGHAQGGAAVGGNLPNAHANERAFETIGMRQERIKGEADTRAANAGGRALEANGMARANERAVVAVTNAGPSSDHIRRADVNARSEIIAGIDGRISAGSRTVGELNSRARTLSGEAKADFKAAMKDVDAREKDLKASVKAARKASPEAWAESRAHVAASYEAYTQSLARAETLAGAGAAAGPSR